MARNKTLELAQHFGIGPFVKKRSQANTTTPVEEPEKPLRRTGTLPDAPLEILFAQNPYGYRTAPSDLITQMRELSYSLSEGNVAVGKTSGAGSTLSTQIQKQSVSLFFGSPGVGKSEMVKEFTRLYNENFKKIEKKTEVFEENPFAFRFQREGMCYQVQFADAFGDTHPDLNKVSFYLSSQQPGKNYLKDHMRMRRAEAQFAIDVIAASLTIDQHEKYAATLQRLRDHLPTPQDDLRNEQIERLEQDTGAILKYITFEEDNYDKNEFIDKLNKIFSESRSDRLKFIIPFKKLTP